MELHIATMIKRMGSIHTFNVLSKTADTSDAVRASYGVDTEAYTVKTAIAAVVPVISGKFITAAVQHQLEAGIIETGDVIIYTLLESGFKNDDQIVTPDGTYKMRDRAIRGDGVIFHGRLIRR